MTPGVAKLLTRSGAGGKSETIVQDSSMLWQMLVFLGPLILSNLIQSISASANGIYVGQLLGTTPYAVVSLVMPLMFFFASIGIAVSSGASILAAQAWGSKDPAKLRVVAQTALGLAFTFGLTLALIGISQAGLLIRALHAPSQMHADATLYAQILFAALPVQFVSMTVAAFLRSTGAPKASLYLSIAAFIVTVICSPILITGRSGEKFGVAGAAIALFLAQLASLVWTLWYAHSRKHVLATVINGPWQVDISLLRTMIKLGLPVSLFFIVGALADLALLSLVTAHGIVAVAAWGGVRQVMTYVQLPAMSIAIAASTLAAQAVGAQEAGRLNSIVAAALLLNLVISGTLAVVLIVTGPVLVSYFINDPQVIATASTILNITVWGNIAFGMASALTSVMRACGYVLEPTIISLGCLVLVLNPVAYALHAVVGLPGIWMGYPITYCCALLLQWAFFAVRVVRAPIGKLV